MPLETTVIGSYTRPDWLIEARRSSEVGELRILFM
jgi:methionine synthase II (cobalamin-independent)|tara:strand:- start:251 stop:355 length:105 start_codon:yes stop_codon:yes gene_type:complete